MIKKCFMVVLLSMAFVMAAGVSSTFASPNSERFIVFTDDEAANAAVANEVDKTGGIVVKKFGSKNDKGLIVQITETAKNSIVKIKGIAAIEPDVVIRLEPEFKAAIKPPTNYLTKQITPWGIKRIRADQVPEEYGAGTIVNVAIIDSGIYKEHPDLKKNIRGGINLAPDGGNSWDDPFGHGTLVAGVCAAVDNKIGVIGVAPKSNLWAVRVLDSQGQGYLSDFIEGIYWSADNGMDVINMSVGIPKTLLDGQKRSKKALEQAVEYAYSKGILLVAAAGNSGNDDGKGDNVDYPARLESVIAAAATDINDVRPFWSSTGPCVEAAAPGVDILSALPDFPGFEPYYAASGTSFASPHVAGAAALLMASKKIEDKNGQYGIADETREIIDNSCTALGEKNLYGHGLINVKNAFKYLH
jgi:subtilisin family serine protease